MVDSSNYRDSISRAVQAYADYVQGRREAEDAEVNKLSRSERRNSALTKFAKQTGRQRWIASGVAKGLVDDQIFAERQSHLYGMQLMLDMMATVVQQQDYLIKQLGSLLRHKGVETEL